MKSPKAIIYTRVSTEDQAENGTSLETQELVCLRKAAELSAQVVSVCRDEGVSGARYLSRGGVQAALADIEAGKANLLIVYSISRLSRDVEHQQAIKKRVERTGGRLIVCDMPMEDTEEGELMFGISGTFAQYERKLIRKRSVEGRKRRAEQQKQPTRLTSPYGYHIVTIANVIRGEHPAGTEGTYLVNEEEAGYAREIFARYAGGASIRQVALWLEGEGVPSPSGNQKWHPSSVRNILRNSVYKGEAVYGRRSIQHDETRLQRGLKLGFVKRITSKETWIIIPAPALVDAATWELCQKRLEGNQVLLGGNPTRKYMLSGLLRCPHCGKQMYGERTPGKHGDHHYYHCRFYCERKHGERYYYVRDIDSMVLHSLMEVARTPDKIEAALRAYAKLHRREDQSQERSRLHAALEALALREQKTARAQVDALTKGRSTEVYDTLLDEIAAERKRLHAKLQAIGPDKPTTEPTPQSQAEILTYVLEGVEEALYDDEATPAEKQAVLATLIETITPTPEDVTIRLRSQTVQSIFWECFWNVNRTCPMRWPSPPCFCCSTTR